MKLAVAAVILSLVAADAAPKKVHVINGQPVRVVPAERVRELGLDRKPIPPEKNAATLLLKAVERYRRCPTDLSKAWDQAQKRPWGDDLAKLRPWVKRNEPVLALLREAAKRPECRFPVFSRTGELQMLFAALMPQLASMRELARFCLIRGHEFEGAGRTRQALECYLLAIRLGRKMIGDGFLITDLVGIAVEAIGLKATAECLDRTDADAATLAWLAKSLDEVAARPLSWRGAMEGERAGVRQAVPFLPQMMGPRAGGLLRSRLCRIVVPDRTMVAEVNAFYARLIALGKRPRWEALRQIRDLQRRGWDVPGLSRWNFMAYMLVPAVFSCPPKYAGDEAQFDALRIAVAVLRYRKDTGRLPPDLKALTPKYLPKPLPDPFTGKPFVYRRTETGWKVYSLGPNLRDDGGVLARWRDVGFAFKGKEVKR